MIPTTAHVVLALLPVLPLAAAQYTATYTVGSLPASSEEGQSGTNQCGTSSSQTSECQNVYINAVDDFCLWGPPATTSDEGDGTSKIGNVEQIVVSYCLKDGYGTRLIPEGTIKGAHFVKVVNDKVSYVQVTGQGDLTSLLIPAGDEGGELDPHSWTGLGNPQGGLAFTNAFSGSYEQTHEWTSFMSATTFCIRACKDGPNAPGYCQHIYDTLDCGFTIPGSQADGFDDCNGDPTEEAPGVYSGSTFQQGDATTPAPHPAGATSQCTTYSTIGGGSANVNAVTAAPASASAFASAFASASASVSASASASAAAVASASAYAYASVAGSGSSARASASSTFSIASASGYASPASSVSLASSSRLSSAAASSKVSSVAVSSASSVIGAAVSAASSAAKSAASSATANAARGTVGLPSSSLGLGLAILLGTVGLVL